MAQEASTTDTASQEENDTTAAQPAGRIELAPFVIPIFRNHRQVGRANIELIVEVTDSSQLVDIKKRLPQMRADFLTALSQLSKEQFRIDRPIEPDLVRYITNVYADRRFGKNAVSVFVKQDYLEPV